MNLTPREKDKLMIAMAAIIAETTTPMPDSTTASNICLLLS